VTFQNESAQLQKGCSVNAITDILFREGLKSILKPATDIEIDQSFRLRMRDRASKLIREIENLLASLAGALIYVWATHLLPRLKRNTRDISSLHRVPLFWWPWLLCFPRFSRAPHSYTIPPLPVVNPQRLVSI